ncbi:hypothetical protein [Kribbella sp. NPDC000426]|uniref:hypothetical protein n=1 Tax=Kribbella sp. NPDC000426 TaxID=3154255 RepID=UPI00331FFC83
MAVQVGEVVPAADVRRFVEGAEHRHGKPAAGRGDGVALGGLDEAAVRAVTSGPALAAPSRQAVDGAGAADELVRGELRTRDRAGFDPGRDAVGHLLRGAEHAAVLPLRCTTDRFECLGQGDVGGIPQHFGLGGVHVGEPRVDALLIGCRGLQRAAGR